MANWDRILRERLTQRRSWPFVYTPRCVIVVITVFKTQELVTLVLGSGKGTLYAAQLRNSHLGSPFRHSRMARPRLKHRSDKRRDCPRRHYPTYQRAVEHAIVGYP